MEPDTMTYTALLSVLAGCVTEQPNLCDDAEEFLRYMREYGPTPDVVTYNVSTRHN